MGTPHRDGDVGPGRQGQLGPQRRPREHREHREQGPKQRVAPPRPLAPHAAPHGQIHPGAPGHSGRTGGSRSGPALCYQAARSGDSKGPETSRAKARPMGRDERGSSFVISTGRRATADPSDLKRRPLPRPLPSRQVASRFPCCGLAYEQLLGHSTATECHAGIPH